MSIRAGATTSSRAVAEPPTCFVAMSAGATNEARALHTAWFDLVIHPAVVQAGFTPFLSASINQPVAINDEIRSHLVNDAMVVADLGGLEATEAPNPNVMYELGIRHAMNTPVVIMAWEDQRLPFDIANQRILLCRRNMTGIVDAKERLVAFLQAAARGEYYRPMDAVGRQATLDTALAGR